MEILIIWIGTIVTSFGMEMANELRMFKDAADSGYKIDTQGLFEFLKQINPNETKVTLMSLLIPGANIVSVLQRTVQYNNSRPMLLSQLSVIDSLIPMTKEEKENYKKKPSALNALIISAKPVESLSISYTDNDGKSTIWFKIENDNFIIVKSEGPVSNLTNLEQRSKLEEKLTSINKKISPRMTTNELSQQLKSKNNIDLTNSPIKEELIKDDKTNQIPSLKEQRQQLENLKESILNNYETITNHKDIDDQVLSKRDKH
jgi:hypothetical protein